LNLGSIWWILWLAHKMASYFWLIWEILENDVIQMTRKKSLSGVLLGMSSKNNETIARNMKQQMAIPVDQRSPRPRSHIFF
jgi:hypothetical protein